MRRITPEQHIETYLADATREQLEALHDKIRLAIRIRFPVQPPVRRLRKQKGPMPPMNVLDTANPERTE